MQVIAGKSTHETPVAINATPGEAKNETPVAHSRAEKSGTSKRWRWALGAGCAIAVLVLYGLLHSRPQLREQVGPRPDSSAAQREFKARTADLAAAGLLDGTALKMTASLAPASSGAAPQGPMIARTVSLTIQVKDVGAARGLLEALLARYQGYAAELNISTPENAARTFTASLRIPAPALESALAELRKLGRVQNETQSGEEVTQQHTDLVARLRNARETEQRLLAILQQRTGKVEEILQVEEQISSTRGEIERMEAEQKALEHRVDFATVQLQLAEQFKAQLNTTSASVGTRVRNAFVNGLGNAGDCILGILLFLEEYGPVLLVWFAVLGTPAWLVWRRFRRAESRA